MYFIRVDTKLKFSYVQMGETLEFAYVSFSSLHACRILPFLPFFFFNFVVYFLSNRQGHIIQKVSGLHVVRFVVLSRMGGSLRTPLKNMALTSYVKVLGEK